MAVKYILLPDDLYKNLISSKTEPDVINLDYTKKILDKTKNQKKLNLSTKNALYNRLKFSRLGLCKV